MKTHYFFIALFLSLVSTCLYAGPNIKKAEGHVADGGKYYDKGDYEAAKSCYLKAIIAAPDYSGAHYNLAVVLTQMNDVEGAIKEYKEVIRINPQDAVAHNNLGMLYAEQNNKDLAVLEFNQAVKIDPNLAMAHNSLGDMYYKEGRYEEAVKEFKEVVRLSPESEYGYNNLGNAYFKLGKYDDAIAQYNQVIEINPKTVYALTNKAQVYIKMNNPAFALSCLNQALKCDPNNATIYNFMGDVNWLKGDEAESIKNYKKAISIKKDYAEAYYKLGKLCRYSDMNSAVDYLTKYLEYGKDPERRARAEKFLKMAALVAAKKTDK